MRPEKGSNKRPDHPVRIGALYRHEGFRLRREAQSEAALSEIDDLRLAAWLAWMTPFETALSS